MAHLFYQSGNLITLKADGYHHSIFRSTKQILAESFTDSARKRELLATDMKNSIMYVQDSAEKEEHAYTAFGHSTNLPSKRTLQGFNGEFIDRPLGAYQLGLGYRTYSPDLMRFQSPDSLAPFEEGGINCYTYCNGDPVNYTDPTGHTLVHLKNGQTMRVGKNSAVALPHKFKPSTLKRTTSHASALKTTARRDAITPEPANYFMKITEPDVFKQIIDHLSFRDAIAFSNSSRIAYEFTRPLVNSYIRKIFTNEETIRMASGGGLPGVPSTFSQTIGLPRATYLDDIDRIQPLGGHANFLRLIEHSRQEARLNARRVRRGSLEDLIVAAD